MSVHCTTANKQVHAAVTALMVFTHINSVHILPKTCRPTRAPSVKVWHCPLRLSHTISIPHGELFSVYYTGRPMRRTPVMAVIGIRQQAAYVRLYCTWPVTIGLTTVHAGTTNEFEYEFEFCKKISVLKNEFNIPNFLYWTDKRKHSALKIAINSSCIMATLPVLQHIGFNWSSALHMSKCSVINQKHERFWISMLLNILCTSAGNLCYAKSNNSLFMCSHVPEFLEIETSPHLVPYTSKRGYPNSN